MSSALPPASSQYDLRGLRLHFDDHGLNEGADATANFKPACDLLGVGVNYVGQTERPSSCSPPACGPRPLIEHSPDFLARGRTNTRNSVGFRDVELSLMRRHQPSRTSR